MQIITCQPFNILLRYSLTVVMLGCLLAGVAFAEASVSKGNSEVNIGSDNEVENVSGGIAEDVEIEGVAIINEKVYIDGVRIPSGTREVRSSKTGKHYRIVWGAQGNITVTEK
jgi:hypothetical protein